jgi:hypothetical protein
MYVNAIIEEIPVKDLLKEKLKFAVSDILRY